MSYDKAANLLRLAICAAGRVGMTLGEIEEMFECDRRTAQRMTVKLMEVFIDAERWVDEDDQRPRWRLPSSSITSFLTPSPEELAVLARASEKLAKDGAANEARILKGLEEKVLATIPKSARARIEVDEEALLQALGLAARPGPRPISNELVDQTLVTALKGRRAVDILYRGVRDKSPRWRGANSPRQIYRSSIFRSGWASSRTACVALPSRATRGAFAGPSDRSFANDPSNFSDISRTFPATIVRPT